MDPVPGDVHTSGSCLSHHGKRREPIPVLIERLKVSLEISIWKGVWLSFQGWWRSRRSYRAMAVVHSEGVSSQPMSGYMPGSLGVGNWQHSQL